MDPFHVELCDTQMIPLRAIVSVQLQGRPKAPPATLNASRKSSGDKNNGGGANLPGK